MVLPGVSRYAIQSQSALSDEIENGSDPKDFRFYVRGKPVLHDPSLKPGTAECVTWPEKM
jgi:hypothetical protein